MWIVLAVLIVVVVIVIAAIVGILFRMQAYEDTLTVLTELVMEERKNRDKPDTRFTLDSFGRLKIIRRVGNEH